MKTNHITVLAHEAVQDLQVKKNHWYVDGTFGGGGHTKLILEEGGKVLAFDFDAEAIKRGQEMFASQIETKSLVLSNENFTQIKQVIEQHQLINKVSGVLFDFGTSTDQLMSENRGFSFSGEGELDMRMDQRLGVKAKDLLAILPEQQLADIFFNFGGERNSKRIAKKIAHERKAGNFIQTNKDLSNLVESINKSRGKIHPATRVFQALRIAVNDELNNISQALPVAFEVLSNGGRIVTISFHEGEDRIVKQQFKSWQESNLGEMVFKKAISPSEEEIMTNPRSRSAKLRVFEKNEKSKI